MSDPMDAVVVGAVPAASRHIPFERFRSARGSRVTVNELRREVAEYFTIGLEVEQGDVVLDVGANIGLFAAEIVARVGTSTRIYCFEPSPDTCAALRENIRNVFPREANVVVEEVGLTSDDDQGKSAPFYNFRRFPTNNSFDLAGKRREVEVFFEDRGQRTNHWFSRKGGRIGNEIGSVAQRFLAWLPTSNVAWSLVEKIAGLEVVEARVRTLSAVIDEVGVERIDVLKIDVEGKELDVLRGIRAAHWPLVQQIVLETNNVGGQQSRILELIRAQGFVNIQVAEQTTSDNGLASVMLLAKR